MSTPLAVPSFDDLVRRDPVLGRLVAEFGPHPRRRPVPVARRFDAVAQMICYQQLAGNAAAAISSRMVAALGGEVTPARVLALGPDALRAVGLSGAKTASILDLADKVDRGEVRFDRMGRLDDDAVSAQLSVVRGIGPWTAHMFLLSTLARPDVWPVGDYGVRLGFGRAWGLAATPSAKELEPLGDPYRPHRSAIAWYCWRVADQKVTPPGTTGAAQ